MGKVFRYHQGVDTIEDWQSSSAYGKKAIDAIEDPAGATARKEITSIPSPFARVDLVKTAFESVAKSQQLDGHTIYHKMVSEALDIGEIFFNLNRFQNNIKIIVWDKKHDLQNLLQSDNRKHRLLGETLQLYLDQDAAANNFDALQRLYLLNYTAGPNPINIIGGTSPSSLFFTSANQLSNYVDDIRFGNHEAFSEVYQPLYERDFEFQKYLYGLRKFFTGDFTKLFKGVNDYLDVNFRKLDHNQREEIRSFSQDDFNDRYDRLSVKGDGNHIEILGHNLHQRVEEPTIIEELSGFTIDSSKYTDGVKPMVLPVDTYTEKVRYISSLWDSQNKAPVLDEKSLNERTLPFDGRKYPYLTISDFLEPYIIRTIYPINKQKYFDGNLIQNEEKKRFGYLLPIKKEYFNFFDTDDLLGVTTDGKKRIEIRQGVANSVHVTLRIPIQNGKHISYERIYYAASNDYEIAQPSEQANKGAVIENIFSVSVYPFIKLYDASLNNYRIAIIDRDISPHTQGNRYKLQFYKNNENQQTKEKTVTSRSEKSTDHRVGSNYYVIEGDEFDYVQLSHNWGSGLIIPRFTSVQKGTSQFKFAIDFGTTNTHIEYRVNDEVEAQPFEINESDVQLATLFDSENPEAIKAINTYKANILVDTLQQEFVPELINREHEFNFPVRTAISSKKTLELSGPVFPLADFNLSFIYEKYQIVDSEVRTNLKWANYSENTNEIKIIESYFENILLLIRNKVFLNNGNLEKTKMVWLYPSSMTEHRIDLLERTWNDLYRKYISNTILPTKISESIAPFYYFNKNVNVPSNATPVVSIDIGGGTSDIVIFFDDKPIILTSVRYAANSIFGDPYGRIWKLNGFVQHYIEIIKNELKQNDQKKLLIVLEDIQKKGKSEDIIAFFFSIEKNKSVIEKNIDISFHKKLSLNNDFKILFLLFYSALIYHIAHLVKATGLKAPKNITFSGTGSKIINIIGGGAQLSDLTGSIFRKVSGDENLKERIKLVQDLHPKEISCKGALMADEHNTDSIHEIKKVLVGTKDHILIPDVKKTYLDLDETIENSVIEEYSSFLDLFFSLNDELNFKNKFGIGNFNSEVYKSYLMESALEDLKTSIKLKRKELQGNTNDNLEESLFFYPLIGGLSNLAYQIYRNLNKI